MIRKVLALLMFAAVSVVNAAEYKVASPDGKVEAKVVCNNGTNYSLSYNGQVLIVDSPVSMTLSD